MNRLLLKKKTKHMTSGKKKPENAFKGGKKKRKVTNKGAWRRGAKKRKAFSKSSENKGGGRKRLFLNINWGGRSPPQNRKPDSRKMGDLKAWTPKEKRSIRSETNDTRKKLKKQAQKHRPEPTRSC